MIWVFICYIAHAKVNTLQPMIILQLSHWIMELTYKKRFPTFSPTIHENKWILSSLDDFWTWVDVVITNSIHTNLVQCVSTTTTHVATVAIQNKAQSYIERTLGDDFIPLAIDIWLSPSSF
jgi:hypothetical protein